MSTKNTPETIEALSRKLERVRLLSDLQECRTLEDFQAAVENLRQMVENDKQDG